jgi:hypothetical protein
MNQLGKKSKNEDGFVLVVALMIMAILSLIGLAGLNTSMFEEQIAGNEWVAKQTFYQADAGAWLDEQLLFENAVCSTTKGGFTPPAPVIIGGRIAVIDLQFSESKSTDPVDVSDDNTKRYAVYYPYGVFADTEPHTNFLSKFATKINPGSGLQMISGYEGLGAGAAGGGTSREYVVASQHRGRKSSESLIMTHWRLDNFILSSAASSDCKY